MVTYVSENVAEVTGHNQNDFYKDSGFWIKHIHPEDIESMRRFYNEWRSGTSAKTTFRFKCKDGSYKLMVNEANAILDGNGKAVEFMGTG